jgi:hypothetical protein
MSTSFTITIITLDALHNSIFVDKQLEDTYKAGMLLTQQIGTKSIRLRTSQPGYITDWHCTQDPTLIVVQQGTLRISIQNGEHKDFTVGQSFVAQDVLANGIVFNSAIHGHQAQVIGDTSFSAIHIKLTEPIS